MAVSLRRALRLLISQLPQQSPAMLRALLCSSLYSGNSTAAEKVISTEKWLQKLYWRCCQCLEREAGGQLNISFPEDREFPSFLRDLKPPLKCLFWQGRLITSRGAAVIGCRNPSNAALVAAATVTKQLTADNNLIVSGLALGCDSQAHRCCLAAGGSTLAILPSGLCNIFPRENQPLATTIIANGGTLWSEYLPDTPVRKWQCVQRNRLQSSASKLLVLIASSLRGGSMHTIRWAQRQQREIFVWPPEMMGSLLPAQETAGPYWLLSQGIAKKWCC